MPVVIGSYILSVIVVDHYYTPSQLVYMPKDSLLMAFMSNFQYDGMINIEMLIMFVLAFELLTYANQRNFFPFLISILIFAIPTLVVYQTTNMGFYRYGIYGMSGVGMAFMGILTLIAFSEAIRSILKHDVINTSVANIIVGMGLLIGFAVNQAIPVYIPSLIPKGIVMATESHLLGFIYGLIAGIGIVAKLK